MSGTVEIREHGVEGVPRVQPLWEDLFDHHVSIGAAGLHTIPREASWSSRRAYYESLFSHEPNMRLWFATLDGATVGYATAYETQVGGERVYLLETLSVSPLARGRGIGTRFMNAVDQAARDAGIRVGTIEVMGGNARTRSLYLRHGYAPYAEAWMRSTPPESLAVTPVDPKHIARVARQLGLHFSTTNGPDDTWESANEIVELKLGVSTATSATDDAESPTDAGAEWMPKIAAMRELFALLESAGLWTIRFEIPAAPAAQNLRDFLSDEKFQMSTERLMHSL